MRAGERVPARPPRRRRGRRAPRAGRPKPLMNSLRMSSAEKPAGAVRRRRAAARAAAAPKPANFGLPSASISPRSNCAALLRVGQEIIGGRNLGELRLRLGVVLVLVGVIAPWPACDRRTSGPSRSPTAAPRARYMDRASVSLANCAAVARRACRRPIWSRRQGLSRMRRADSQPISKACRMPAQTLTERLFDDADTAPIDPFALFEEWFAARPRERAQRPARHGAGHRRCRRHARCPHGAAERPRPPRLLLLHQFRERQGRAAARASARRRCCFHWKSLRRQVRVRGPVEVVDRRRGRRLFRHPRARVSQLGAHASRSSRGRSRAAPSCSSAVETLDESSGTRPGGPARRTGPASGWCRIEIEFWKDGAFRLHDRVRFTRDRAGRCAGRASGSIPEALPAWSWRA